MKLTHILYSGLAATLLMTAPAMAETNTGANTGVGVNVGGVGVNANTSLSAGANTGTTAQQAGRLNNQVGTSTFTRTRVNSEADTRLDANKNGFLDENEISLSSNTRANTRINSNNDMKRPRDIGNMGVREHATSDNRIGASYGND